MLPEIRVEDRSGGQHVSVAASRGDVVTLLKSDAAFRAAFAKVIAEAPYEGLFWETPPLSAATAGLPFECMIVPSAAVGRLVADGKPFARFIGAEAGSDAIVRQRNLGGDAELIIPCDGGDADYAHLATFLRTASVAQVDNLWRETGEAASHWLAEAPSRPFWISTSGLGVAWLHIRLDTRPKYYSYAPYKPSHA